MTIDRFITFCQAGSTGLGAVFGNAWGKRWHGMMGKALGYLALAVLLVAGVATAWLYIQGGSSQIPQTWPGGELRVGYSSEPPYCFRKADGTVTGQAPEIAKAVFDRLGITRIRWVLLDFSEAMDALVSGRIDMIANGMFITPERLAKIAFSLPYNRSPQGLLVRYGNPKGLHAYEDLAARTDVVAAVLDGSVEQETLRRFGLPPQCLFVVPDPSDGLAAVRQDRADCLALSAPTVAWLAGEAPGEVAVAVPLQTTASAPAAGCSAFGFRREDVRLREEVDRVLWDYIGSPEHLVLGARFGFDRQALPEWSSSP
jgi:polar amino acid transport system substrate-binding protein